jgi:hypothetical protein
MHTNQITKNRNNGKSKNYYNHTKKNIILTDNDDQSKPQIRDLSLFKMAKTFKVKINRRQRIKWFFYIKNGFDVDLLRKNIEKICSRYGYIGKREIAVVKDGWRNQLVIDTPIFLFTLDNIVQFSNDLLELAKANSIFYERWDVVPPKTTILSKITKWFN